MQNPSTSVENKRFVGLILGAAALLLLPAVAMQFNSEVRWDPADFVLAGALLFGTAVLFELVSRRGGNMAYQMGAGIGLGAMLLLIWINLAVGIIGDESNPANLLYFGVPFFGFLGASLARFQPSGMARAMFGTALAQALVPMIALLIWKPDLNLELPGVNAFFVILFVGSGLLFRSARGTSNARN